MKTIEEIVNGLYSNFEAIEEGENFVASKYRDEEVEVIAFVNKNGTKEVEVINLHHDERIYNNIEDYIASCLPSFSELLKMQQDEYAESDLWQSHGFANEADYNRYRYGRW